MTAIPLTGNTAVEQTAAVAPLPPPAGQLKLLFLLPFAPDRRGSHGGARATAAMIEMLGKSHRVCAIYLVGDGDPAPQQLPLNCERTVAVPKQRRTAAAGPIGRLIDGVRKIASHQPQWAEECWSPVFATEVAALAAEFEPDIVHHEFHVMAQYVPMVRAACPRTACVVTEHEPGITADARAGASRTLRERLGASRRRRAWRNYERRTLRQADGIIAFTETDAAALAKLLGRETVAIAVIPLRLPQDAPTARRRPPPVQSDFVFVGNFRHPPNLDAALRLVSGIFPIILRDLPDATLSIVGVHPPAELLAASSDRIRVTGRVDDPSIFLAGAAVVLVPLRQGGGLRVKMLEACAAGKAIVASPLAVEGLSLRDGEEVLIAHSDAEFAAKAIAILADPKARKRLEAASRRWWEQEHETGRWSAQYEDFYSTVLSGGRIRARSHGAGLS